jgi:hypothetical protein
VFDLFQIVQIVADVVEASHGPSLIIIYYRVAGAALWVIRQPRYRSTTSSCCCFSSCVPRRA